MQQIKNIISCTAFTGLAYSETCTGFLKTGLEEELRRHIPDERRVQLQKILSVLNRDDFSDILMQARALFGGAKMVEVTAY